MMISKTKSPAKAKPVALPAEIQARCTACNKQLAVAVDHGVIELARKAGSKTREGVFYTHYQNVAAKAVMPELRSSNKEIIAQQPFDVQVRIAIVRYGVTQRIPQWCKEAELTGEPSPHKAVFQKAKAWCLKEAARLKSTGIGEQVLELEQAVLLIERQPQPEEKTEQRPAGEHDA